MTDDRTIYIHAHTYYIMLHTPRRDDGNSNTRRSLISNPLPRVLENVSGAGGI